MEIIYAACFLVTSAVYFDAQVQGYFGRDVAGGTE